MPNEQNPKPTINPAARRNARRYAVQALYTRSMTEAATIDIEKEFIQYHINQAYDPDYFRELVHGIPTHLDEVDATFSPYLGREIKEIDPIELSVLRVAVYELLKRPDVPYRVIINEALEITKKYGSVDGYKFINGVLDRVAKVIREIETNMPRK